MCWTMSASVSSSASHREPKSSSQYHPRLRTGWLKTNSSHCSKVALIVPIVPGLSQLTLSGHSASVRRLFASSTRLRGGSECNGDVSTFKPSGLDRRESNWFAGRKRLHNRNEFLSTARACRQRRRVDRKSTRLNSSHL